ncbi:MAG: hypothetical protein H6834_17780 [Planctomycetes bacterium]|nr:hypothetical protein [Planctomycetota bacterium]
MITPMRPCLPLLLLLTAASHGRAQDPPTPPGGFAVREILDVDVTWSDGYRTRMDFYTPDAAAPGTGWPGVLAVHGGGGDRKIPDIRQIGRYLAAAGYTVYAYDVREDGETPILNAGWPTPRTPERTLLDSAESHGLAAALLAGSIDLARLAVTGVSQGGAHSIEAAAWSGQLLPLAGFVTHYPTILAAAPEISSLDRIATSMPGGTLANDELIDDLDATDPLLLTLNAGDYATAYAQIQSTFQGGVLPQLRTSSVPLLVMEAWQDFKHQLNASVDALATLSQPSRLHLSAGGHSTPKNAQERLVQQDLRRAWFDHYLKGIANGVTQARYAQLGVEPDEPRYTALQSIWERRQDTQWPPATPSRTFHLRGNGSLTAAVPPSVEVGPTFAHRVDPAYDLLTHVAIRASVNPARLFARIPRIDHAFETPPLPNTMEVYGRTRVQLEVSDTTGVFQLSVALVHVDPQGVEHFITFGTGGVRSGSPGAHTLAFDLVDIAHVVPAGHRLRIHVLNLADHDPPSHRRIRFAPYFTDTDTVLRLEPGAASRIEIPLRAYALNQLPRLVEQPASAGILHRMEVRGGPERAGLPYFVLLGASGEAPGTPLPGGGRVPLMRDAWTDLGLLLLNTPLLPATIGVLDAQGNARPGFAIPAGPIADLLVGMRFSFATLVVDGAALEVVDGSTDLVIVP